MNEYLLRKKKDKKMPNLSTTKLSGLADQLMMICKNYARIIRIFSRQNILNQMIIKKIKNYGLPILRTMKFKIMTISTKFFKKN
jgi:hypothetical protein